MGDTGTEQGCLVARSRTNVVPVGEAIQADRKRVKTDCVSPGRDSGVAVTDRGDKFHQLDDHLMPGQIGQTAADIRDGGIELLTTQRVEQIRVRGRHPARQDV